MKIVPPASLRRLLSIAVAGVCTLAANSVQAGNVYLTGHDVTLHGGQNGYDAVILDYLRGKGTVNEIAKGSYRIGFVGTKGSGSESFTGGGNVTGLAHGAAIPLVGSTLTPYASAKFYDAEDLAATAPAARAAILAGIDVLVVASHVNCGGCSLTTAGSNALNSIAGDIATAFNAGLDIFGQASSNIATYYNFLPAGAVATGAPIGGSSGFAATPAGVGIGITDGGASMINGFPTHNRFTSQAPAFTVFEVRPQGTAPAEVISIGLRDGVITTGGISTGGTTPDAGSTALLLALVLPFLGFLRRKVRS